MSPNDKSMNYMMISNKVQFVWLFCKIFCNSLNSWLDVGTWHNHWSVTKVHASFQCKSTVGLSNVVGLWCKAGFTLSKQWHPIAIWPRILLMWSRQMMLLCLCVKDWDILRQSTSRKKLDFIGSLAWVIGKWEANTNNHCMYHRLAIWQQCMAFDFHLI